MNQPTQNPHEVKPHSKASRQHRGLLGNRRVFLVSSVFLLALFLVQVPSVPWMNGISGFDEIGHIDYAVQLSDGKIPTWDDDYSERTLEVTECFSSSSLERDCIETTRPDPRDFPAGGKSYQAQQAPVGYLLIALGFKEISSPDDYHDTQILILRLATFAQVVLLALAWGLLVAQVSGRILPALGASAFLALNPLVFQSFTYVTNDAAAIVVATFLAFQITRWLLSPPKRKTVASASAVGWGVLAGLTKLSSAIVALPFGTALAFDWLRSTNTKTRRHLVPLAYVIVVLMSALFAATLFGYWQSLRSVGSARTVFPSLLPPAPESLADQAVVRLGDFTSMLFGAGVYPVTLGVALFGLLGGGVFLLALRYKKWNPQDQERGLRPDALAAGVLVSTVLLLLLTPLAEFARSGLGTTDIGRYLAPLVPLMALLSIPALTRHPLATKVVVASGIVLALIGTNDVDLIVANIEALLARVGISLS